MSSFVPMESPKLTPIEFAKERLSANPEASFADIKAQAKLEGLTVYPVVYGRAKALLKLVPTAPYGSKSKARKKLAEAASLVSSQPVSSQPVSSQPVSSQPVSSQPVPEREVVQKNGRTATANIDPLASLESMVMNFKESVQKRDRYRAVLLRIAEIIQSELDLED